MKLSHTIIGRLSIGQIVNLASNDVQRFDLVGESKTSDGSKIFEYVYRKQQKFGATLV